MKNLKHIIITLMLATGMAYGQQQSSLKRVSASEFAKSGVEKNLYIYNDNLDKFVGTWIGNENGKQIKVVLLKKSFRLTKDSGNRTEMELISGNFEYLHSQTKIASYALTGSIGGDSNILNAFIDVKSRKTQASLSFSFLQNGELKLEFAPNIFGSNNDKDFEFKDIIVLTKQQ